MKCRYCDKEFNKGVSLSNHERNHKEYEPRLHWKTKEYKIKKSKEHRERYKEKYKKLKHEYYLKNREKIINKVKKYYEKNKDKIKEYALKYAKCWKEKNYDKYLELKRWYQKRRKSIKRQIKEIFTKEEWNNKLNETNGFCFMCKKYVGIDNLTLDHIYPISKAEKGRIYAIDDVQPLCNICNIKKGNKIGDDYAR